MTMLFTVYLTFAGIALVVAVMLLIRNERVHSWRMGLLDALASAATVDIREGREWEWRYIEFRTISHAFMLYRPFSPLESFYPLSPARTGRYPWREVQA